MTQKELTNVFKYIVKKCDILINNGYLLLGIILLYGEYFIKWLITKYNKTQKGE